MSLDLTIKELHRMFDFFNHKFYNGQLEKPVILIQSNGRHKGTLGWCTTKKVWNDKENSASFYEITICAEYLNRPIKGLIGTLLHEMVHLHNLQYKIKDTSRGGTYHNKKFKEIAEENGLIISYDERIGWSLTELQESTEDMINELKPSNNSFKIARFSPFITDSDASEGEETEMPEKPRSSMRKYVCPVCGSIIRATKDVNVICGDCKVAFQLVGK